MKKYLLVSLAVLLTAGFAWTQVKVEEPKVDITADATVTWGIDLGTGSKITPQHGFKNEGNFKVKVPLINKSSSTSKGEGAVYAEVEVKDVELFLQAKKGKNGDWVESGKNDPATRKDGGFDMFGSVGELSAKFVFYGAYLQIFDKPGMKTNYASIWEPLKINKPDEYDGKEYEDKFKFEPGFDGYGVKFGYAKKELMDLDVGLKLVSNSDWTGTFGDYKKNTTPPTDNRIKDSRYGIGLDFGMKPFGDMLAFNLGINATLGKASEYRNAEGKPSENLTSDKVLFGLGAEVTSKPIKGLELKLGFDGAQGTNVNSGNFAWDMLFDAKYKWVSTGMYVASKGTLMESILKDNTKSANLAVYLKFETKGDDEKADSFLVKGLDAGAYLGMFDLLSYRTSSQQLPMLLKVWGSYKVMLNDSMWIKPFAELWGETMHKDKNNKETFGIAYNVGVTYAPAEKVEVTAKWQHGDAPNKDVHYNKVLKQTMNVDTTDKHNGRFTLAVKVKY